MNARTTPGATVEVVADVRQFQLTPWELSVDRVGIVRHNRIERLNGLGVVCGRLTNSPESNIMNEKPFRLAVRAVIRDEAGRCLLLRRSPANKGFVGCWEWPGGKVDPGEEFDHGGWRPGIQPAGG